MCYIIALTTELLQLCIRFYSQWSLILYNVLFRANGKRSGCILDPSLRNNQSVMLPVPASPGMSLGNHNHRFHSNHHAGLQYGVHVLKKLQTPVSPIVVRKNACRVTTPDNTILQNVVLHVNFVEFSRNIAAALSWLD